MMFKQCDLLNFLRFIKLTENERLLLSKNLTAKNIQDQLIILQVRIMQFYFKCFQTIFITSHIILGHYFNKLLRDSYIKHLHFNV